ncbi:hypothetical protein KXD40_001948 [Peronospora effusa]|uniref:Uncharacterized protein n=1 Tax=Peronospora effusa TaxID=542832 RepID=A0A3R7WAB8_9STRA|nr:hypothetical protein DD237_002853 [Peronospora effusa]UIZ26025.1 hypothetical protein KXD40_001948 [Peronospora effusa]CAI5726207.1 unnamed protein product [Peronospora effusa]
MVGFLRKKKSDKAVLSGGTVLDRKGKVDNASLLDGDGEPTEGSLYDANGKRVSHGHGHRKSDEENRPNPVNNAGYPPVMATGMYPRPHQQQQPGVYGMGNSQPQQQFGQQQYPGQQQYSGQQQYPGQQPQHQFGQQPLPQQYGQQPLPQQYGQPQPQRYGQPQQLQSGQPSGYGQQQHYPPTTLGGQYEYPVRYGQMPPPMPSAAPKRSRFRLPSIGKKN